MFSLISGLWKYLRRKDEYYVVILGLDNAGKTTFLEQVKGTYVPSYKPLSHSQVTTTVGLNLGKIDVGSVQLTFWDVGGQRDLQSLWDKYYEECHAIVYVVDSSDRDRLEESFMAFNSVIEDDSLLAAPLLILANKQDVQGALSVDDIKSHFQASAHKLNKRDCTVMSLSAIHGEGIQKSIEWLLACCKRNIYRLPNKTDT
ncbi:ADP-ribosylation factor-related protein 1-like [Oscarella lobularis]|uniref:ADP-ribosylation factor-related protein 1-like n=1 Tax=Oscarella lobularis TaxID=121494 RepID=UPI00331403DE